MKAIKILINTLILTLLIAGCGDDSDNKDDNDNLDINTSKNTLFSGSWIFKSELAANTCGYILPLSSDVNMVIEQNGTEIKAIYNDKVFIGITNEDKVGFSAITSYEEKECNVIYSLAVTDVVKNKGDASLVIKRSCKYDNCAATYYGTIKKLKD